MVNARALGQHKTSHPATGWRRDHSESEACVHIRTTLSTVVVDIVVVVVGMVLPHRASISG